MVEDLHNIVHIIADFIHYTIHCIVYINDVFMYSIRVLRSNPEDFVSVSWNLLGYHVEDGRQLRPFPGKVFCQHVG